MDTLTDFMMQQALLNFNTSVGLNMSISETYTRFEGLMLDSRLDAKNAIGFKQDECTSKSTSPANMLTWDVGEFLTQPSMVEGHQVVRDVVKPQLLLMLYEASGKEAEADVEAEQQSRVALSAS